ncbi:hypothetical protein H261_20749 [Paramagnetospirillum caucaseum]|uniref:Uncharacterized protein n=1 Tax=Paramagnetospirillum caucaseum TaxID=1244869 RepID=M2Z131_9PROT|nr:hypothetical protein H261_20749 [Paramagnetospirillum caucaseum]
MKCNYGCKVFIPKNLIHQRSDTVDILVADLHEDGATISQQITGNSQAISQIGQIGVDAVPPCVAEGSDLLRFAGDVVLVAVLHIAAGGGPLEIGIELDAVGWVEIDALHLPP